MRNLLKAAGLTAGILTVSGVSAFAQENEGQEQFYPAVVIIESKPDNNTKIAHSVIGDPVEDRTDCVINASDLAAQLGKILVEERRIPTFDPDAPNVYTTCMSSSDFNQANADTEKFKKDSPDYFKTAKYPVGIVNSFTFYDEGPRP